MGWILFAILVIAGIAKCQETCLSAEEDPYLLFGTKTAYIFANKGVPNNRIHDIIGCQPMAIWLMNRHGSHNPEVDEIEGLQKLGDLKNNILTNYRNGNFRTTNQRMCTSDVNLLEQWEWNARQNVTFAGDLTSDGYITTQQLAQAWKQKYPSLFTDNRHDYLFKYANNPRSTTTFKAFTEGLFRAQAEGYDIPKENDEKLLEPYKFCSAWIKEVEQNNETLSQRHIFESKQEYKEMISNISLRLGFNYDIDKEVILRMYQMCRYNKAWNVAHISPWCAAFSREDLKRLEYAEDLETYYKYGYGTPINQKIGCAYIKNMMQFFIKHLENPAVAVQPRASVHLSEAAALLQLQAALGAARDVQPLTADNYRSPGVRARRWTTSTLAPFNGNIAAVLYKCNPTGNFQIKEQYQVLFLENEREMYLDGCRVGLCDWSHVKTKFGDTTNSCDLEICNGAIILNGFVALVSSVAFYFVKEIIYA